MLAFNLNPAVDSLFSLVLRSTKTFCAIDLHLQVSLRYGRIALFLWNRLRLQGLGMECSEAWIRQRRGCHNRVLRSFRSHLLLANTALPRPVAPFRVVTPCPAPKNPHIPPFPAANLGSIVCTFPHAFLPSENRTQQKQPELVSSMARFDFCLIKQELCGWKSVELKYILHKAYFNTLEILHAIGCPAIGR
jgi:hypothetical protein